MLVASLIAPYLRKFGCYTVPDFIGTRYGGNLARLCAVIILVVASFTYVTAQINGTGTVAARALQIPFELGVWIGLAGILFCSMPGGNAGGDLNSGGAVYRADHCLSDPSVLDVKQAWLWPDPTFRPVRCCRARSGTGRSAGCRHIAANC